MGIRGRLGSRGNGREIADIRRGRGGEISVVRERGGRGEYIARDAGGWFVHRAVGEGAVRWILGAVSEARGMAHEW